MNKRQERDERRRAQDKRRRWRHQQRQQQHSHHQQHRRWQQGQQGRGGSENGGGGSNGNDGSGSIRGYCSSTCSSSRGTMCPPPLPLFFPFFSFYFLVVFICTYMILIQRNRGYIRYRGFRLIPREIRFGIGVTHNGLRCTRVRVRCAKIRPAVYPCSTLVPWNTHTHRTNPISSMESIF